MKEIKPEYIYGNLATVPEIVEPPKMPEILIEDEEREKRLRQRRRQEEKHRQILEQNKRRRAHKRDLHAQRIRMLSLSIGIILIGGLLFLSVYMQSTVTSTKKNIARLEDQLSDINMLNDAAKSRIETAVNLNEIKDLAINKYGMVYADNSHIVYYDTAGNDYMVKY